jgi:spore maturation protein CgeB
MRIALLGSKDFDSLEFHLNDSLRFLKNDVFHIDIKDVISISYRYNYWATKLIKSYDEYVFKKVAYKIIEQNPELVICTYRFIHPLCIEILKKNLPNVPVIHVNPDALTTFEQQQIFASSYDAYFTKDPFIADFMKNKMSLNTFYMPEAFNPRFHKMPEVDRFTLEDKIDIDVVTFGTMYPYRAKMVSQLIDSGIKMALFGTADRRFPKQEITKNFRNEYLTGDRKAEVLYGSKVIFNNFHYAEVNSVNAKFFEIAGIGGFQICDYKPTIAEYSKITPEKFTYKNINEAINLIQYYLKNTQERHQLALDQYHHFLQHHTYEHRINEILECL